MNDALRQSKAVSGLKWERCSRRKERFEASLSMTNRALVGETFHGSFCSLAVLPFPSSFGKAKLKWTCLTSRWRFGLSGQRSWVVFRPGLLERAREGILKHSEMPGLLEGFLWLAGGMPDFVASAAAGRGCYDMSATPVLEDAARGIVVRKWFALCLLSSGRGSKSSSRSNVNHSRKSESWEQQQDAASNV